MNAPTRLNHGAPRQGRVARRVALLRVVVLYVMVALGAVVAATPIAPEAVGAQEPPVTVLDEAKSDLAERMLLAPADIELVRAAAVAWADSCLGVAGLEEFCLQVVTPGFVLWLAAGDEAYRYHTGARAVRLAAGPLPLDHVEDAPLPLAAGRAMRPAARSNGPVTSDLVAGLERAGIRVDTIQGSTAQVWIPVARTVLLANGATVEVFSLAARADRDLAAEVLQGEGAEGPPPNAMIWTVDDRVVILLDAAVQAEVGRALIDLLGEPFRDTRSPDVNAIVEAEPVAPMPAATGTGLW